MNNKLLKLSPPAIWKNFSALNAVPRPSKKESRVIAFIESFGKNLNLETQVDGIGNVLIKKPATKGMENRKTVVLQSHLDMVHQKNNDTDFDFDTQGIKMYVDGDWVRAEGTTLGADNGIGVASIMSILESTTIIHPAIEALFTIDEETGMTGARGLKANLLSGEILLNLDTENDNEIDIGCAGGMDVTATKNYEQEKPNKHTSALKIILKGLSGGHSGMDIHKGHGNANKLLARLLYELQDFDFHIAEFDGGSLRNAIPREGSVVVVLQSESVEAFKNALNQMVELIKDEQKTVDPNLEVLTKTLTTPDFVMTKNAQTSFINSLFVAHNGVYKMSLDIEGLVEASNNVALVKILNGTIKIDCLTRSSVESTKYDLANHLKAAFVLGGFEVAFSGAYPGWKPDASSPILKILTNLYTSTFNKTPEVVACHAGLECGILGINYPNMDMISFGPTIEGAHSPDERASISSTQKFWSFLLEILKQTPVKGS